MSELPTKLQHLSVTYVSIVGGGRKLAGLFPSLLTVLLLALMGEGALNVGGPIVAALYATLCASNVRGDHAKHKSTGEG